MAAVRVPNLPEISFRFVLRVKDKPSVVAQSLNFENLQRQFRIWLSLT
jgi:hypothetical protein